MITDINYYIKFEEYAVETANVKIISFPLSGVDVQLSKTLVKV
jgi:hypothetical protein